MADHFKVNGSAMHKARVAARMPDNYRDKELAEKHAAILTAQLGFKVHVCECFY
jgi:hypothetical protein